MKVSDAQTELFNSYRRSYENALEEILCEFQDKIIELVGTEANYLPLLDRLANQVGWDGFPGNCTIALVDETGKAYPVSRAKLNEIFNPTNSK